MVKVKGHARRVSRRLKTGTVRLGKVLLLKRGLVAVGAAGFTIPFFYYVYPEVKEYLKNSK